MAARWKKFEKDGDRYLLQYRTIGDKRVRPTHRDLHGITLPINSKFWDEYFPPNNWNCRCTVVQVRRSKYTQSNEAEAMRLGLKATAGKYREMFLFNPGKTMTCFPMYNAYTRKACINCKKKPGNLKLAADVPDNELCQVCKILKELSEGCAGRVRRKAKSIQGHEIIREELPGPIKITGASIKEWTNQPHKHYLAKNMLLLDIENVLKKADYLGVAAIHKDSERKKEVKHTYVFECILVKEKSWILVREYNWGEITLHSISDSFKEIAENINKG